VEDFYASLNPNVESYESFCDPAPPEISGDIAFYCRMAGRCGGPVLELACGTGRVSRGVARKGFDVVGLDASRAMLDLAQGLYEADQAAHAGRVTFIPGTMESFELESNFPLALVPFRSFQLLQDPAAQTACLEAIGAHLAPGGAAVLHIFDPRLEYLTGELPQRYQMREGRSALTGRRVVKTLIANDVDMFREVIRQVFRHQEFGDDDTVMRQEDLELCLRWTYRYEFNHLIERSGFAIAEEYGDFLGGPPAYGGERVIVLRRR